MHMKYNRKTIYTGADTAQSISWWATCSTVGIRILPKETHSVQTWGSGAHPASDPMGTVGSFLGGERVRGVKLPIYFPLMPRWRVVELYLHSP
jgi:hypothetical protein